MKKLMDLQGISTDVRRQMGREEQDRSRCCVYVVGMNRRPVKVGFSNDPIKRLRSHQIPHWQEIKLHAVRWFSYMAEAKVVERLVHKELAYHDRSLRGEWFNVTPEQAVASIEHVARHLGFPTYDRKADIPYIDDMFEEQQDRASQNRVMQANGWRFDPSVPRFTAPFRKKL